MERSPWWGGFYERMVKYVKRCLKKVLATSKLKYEELLTVLIKIEGVLNSRPLTYVYKDGEIPLTPSHFVLGRRLLSSPSESEEPSAMNSNEGVARREKYLKTVLFYFWKRWQREYLTQLREQHPPSEKKLRTNRQRWTRCFRTRRQSEENELDSCVRGKIVNRK